MFNEGDLVEFIPVNEFNCFGEFSAVEQRSTIDRFGRGPFTVVQSPVPGTNLLGVYNGVTVIRLFSYRFRLVNPVVAITSLDELM